MKKLERLDGAHGVDRDPLLAHDQDNESLHDLGGLSHLTQLGNWVDCAPGTTAGSVTISGNRGLSLHGLEGVTDIPGDLDLVDIDFTDLSGLDHLANVHGSLAIDQSSALTPLHGLESLPGLGDLTLAHDDVLTDLAGLSHVRGIGAKLEIFQMTALVHLGLTSLTYVGGCQQCPHGGLDIHSTGVPTAEIDALRAQVGW
jgi:hypothetical protein